MKKAKISILSLMLAFTLIMIPTKSEAKGFGTEDSTSTQYIGAGQCLETTVTTLYLFWLPVQTTVDYNIVSC